MNLTQQLEDKKKELKTLISDIIEVNVNLTEFEIAWDLETHKCGYDLEDRIKFHSIRAEIAILEQAIAEIKDIQSQQRKTCGDTPTQQQECRGTNPEEGKVSMENDTTNSADNPQDASRGDNTPEPKLEGSTSNLVVSNLLQKQRQEILDKIIYAYNILENNKFYMTQLIERKDIDKILHDIEQREDEIFLIYSSIKDISVNEAKKELEQLNQPKTEHLNHSSDTLTKADGAHETTFCGNGDRRGKTRIKEKENSKQC